MTNTQQLPHPELSPDATDKSLTVCDDPGCSCKVMTAEAEAQGFVYVWNGGWTKVSLMQPPANLQELELARLSGKSVLDQRAMGEMEWTKWYNNLVELYPHRFNPHTGYAILPNKR